MKAQRSAAVFLLCLPSSLSLNFYEEKKKRVVKKEESRGGKMSKFSHAYYFSLC